MTDGWRGWRPFAWAAAAIYAPYFVAAIITWLFVPCGHCKLGWLGIVWYAPGFVISEAASNLLWRHALMLSQSTIAVLSLAVSAALVLATGWLAGRGRITRRITLGLVFALNACCAWAAFALMQS